MKRGHIQRREVNYRTAWSRHIHMWKCRRIGRYFWCGRSTCLEKVCRLARQDGGAYIQLLPNHTIRACFLGKSRFACIARIDLNRLWHTCTLLLLSGVVTRLASLLWPGMTGPWFVWRMPMSVLTSAASKEPSKQTTGSLPPLDDGIQFQRMMQLHLKGSSMIADYLMNKTYVLL